MIGLTATYSASLEAANAMQGFFDPALSTNTSQLVRQFKGIQSVPSPSAAAPNLRPARPFSEALFNALAEAKVLTSQVAMHLNRDWRSKLFRQLDSLHDIEEWESGDKPLQASSFSTFLKAVLDINPERKPGLGLSSTGHLVAAWTVGSSRLTIEFFEKDRIRWVLSRTCDGEVERFAGDTNVARLSNSLSPYNPEHWFKNGELQPTG